MSTDTYINKVKIVRDKEHLHLLGVYERIAQWQLCLHTDLWNRVDVPTWPIFTDDTGKTFYYGSDGTLVYYYYEVDITNNSYQFRKKYTTTPETMFKIKGVWTIPVLVNTRKRINVVMYMTVEDVEKYIPEGYKLVFVNSSNSYKGNYWTIILNADFKKHKNRFRSSNYATK